MEKREITKALRGVKAARAAWGKAQTEYTQGVDRLMRRLLFEAARARMSVEQVASDSGLTTKRVRALMRQNGLDSWAKYGVLSKRAADTLAANAEIMSIDPAEIDLLSPLAYLPMGSDMKRALQNQTLSSVTEVETPLDDNWLQYAFGHIISSHNIYAHSAASGELGDDVLTELGVTSREREIIQSLAEYIAREWNFDLIRGVFDPPVKSTPAQEPGELPSVGRLGTFNGPIPAADALDEVALWMMSRETQVEEAAGSPLVAEVIRLCAEMVRNHEAGEDIYEALGRYK